METVDLASISYCHLPKDIIFKIFQYLPLRDLFSASCVCRVWRFTLRDPRLWEYLQFSKDDSALFVENCLRLAPNLKSVTFAKCSDVFDVYCQETSIASLSCTSCRIMELLHSRLNSSQIKNIVKVYSRLAFVSYADSQISFPDSIRALLPLGEQLRSLNLSYCVALSDADLVIIAESFPNLTQLDIEGNSDVTDFGLCCVLQHLGPKLAVLRVDGEKLSDNFITMLPIAKNLKCFSIAYAENLSSLGFCMIFSSLHSLETLRLHKVVNLDDEAIAGTIDRCPWLSSITRLELDDCQSLGDKTAVAISRQCRNLRYLSMDWWTDLSDVGMREIILNCPRLEYLGLIGATKVVGAGSFDLNLALLTPLLHQIRLEKCHIFDDHLFSGILNALPHVKVYNYYGELIQQKSNSQLQ